MIVEQVRKLDKEGKTYDLFYNGRIQANVTIEKNTIMNKQLALKIINDIRRSGSVKALTDIKKVDYKEAPPRYKV